MSTNTLFANQWVKRLSFVMIILAVGLGVTILAITAQPVIQLGVFEPGVEQAAIAGSNLTTLSAEDVSAYRWQAMAQHYAGNPTRGSDLTALSAEDVSVYRWQAMAQAYARAPISGNDLTALSAADVSAYRWQAMAQAYAQIPISGGDLTTLSAEDIAAYRWQAQAQFYASHPEVIKSMQP
ncbi:MAG: hypothetical protein P8Z00_10545 [Anaerolineales bacterium]